MTKILLIEDDERTLKSIAEILRLEGYNVITSGNGKDGVEMAIAETPDLIVSNINMSFRDGGGVQQVLRNHHQTKNIPFVFLATRQEIEEARHAVNMGVNDYVTKPLDVNDLLQTVRSQLKEKAIVNEHLDLSKLHSHELWSRSQALDTLINKSEAWEYPKNHIIYKEGSIARFVYFIREGKIITYKSDDHDKDLVMGLYGEKDFVGYVPILENILNIETAETIEHCELVAIPKKEFMTFINDRPEVMKMFLAYLTEHLIEREKRLLMVAYNSLRKKVAYALLALNKKYNHKGTGNSSLVKISRSELASIAGTATESLIRTLTEFKDENLIDISNGVISILNEKELMEV